MRKLVQWLNRNKNEDTILIQGLKLGYAIGVNSWIHSLVSAVLGIIIPLFFDDKKIFLFLLFLLISDFIFAALCNYYQSFAYNERKFAGKTLDDESALLKSILIEMENNNNWKNNIFKTVSNLVCERIYQNFKEIFNIETRVAIEYTFYKNIKVGNKIKKIKFIKMSGRKSASRSVPKKAVEFTKRKKYYSYQIFSENNHGINILEQDKILDDTIWYKNPKNNVDVKKYIGIAVNVYDENEVKFILEIDLLHDYMFGENDDNNDIKLFIEKYLMSYINLLSISYLLNLNNNKKIVGYN